MPTETRKPERPLMPKLAASASTIVRSPVTPKLAGPSARALPQRPLSTPSPSSDPKSPNFKGTVSPNVTPRSSARRSRVGTTPSTPDGALNQTPTMATRPPASTHGQSSAARDSPARFTPAVSEDSGLDLDESSGRVDLGRKFGPVPAEAAEWRPPFERANLDRSYFFNAADIRDQAQKPQRPTIHKKSSSFVYANGTQEHGNHEVDSMPNNQNSWVWGSTSSGPYNSGNATAALPPGTCASSPQSSNVDSGNKSPTKADFHLSYRKGASQVMRPNGHLPSESAHDGLAALKSLPESKPPPQGINYGVFHNRQKTMSISSTESTPTSAASKNELLPDQKTIPHILPAKESPITSPHINTIDGFITSPDVDARLNLDGEHVRSPSSVMSNGEGHRSFTEAAANARRERKVLDLEISNSSLLAINRSLEKEVRKQKAEIRRLRRLSRNTCHSTLISDQSVRKSLGYPSDMTDEEEEKQEGGWDESMPNTGVEGGPNESLSDIDSREDDVMSPGELEERDARHCKGDQWRLRMDLLKHKEFLADSQKVNQSLKKCLGVTEQLIEDGNKALEYQVPTADVGARVLSAEDGEHTDTERSFLGTTGDISSERQGVAEDISEFLMP